jgi:predicted nucleic acid-binding protein
MAPSSVATHLLDKSAFERWGQPAVGRRLDELHALGVLATCAVIDLEILYSARSGDEHRSIREQRAATYDLLPLEQRAFERAIEVQGMLADLGRHRAAGIPDLLIAAAAERAGLTVLHYDSDFDLIASVTSQPTEWVVPRGSID